MTLISFWNSPSLLSDGPFAICRIRTVFATSCQTSCHLLFDIVCHESCPYFPWSFLKSVLRVCSRWQNMPGFPSMIITNPKMPQDYPQSSCSLHCIKKFLLDVTDRSRGTVLLIAYVSGDFISFSKNLMSLQALNFMAGWDSYQIW